MNRPHQPSVRLQSQRMVEGPQQQSERLHSRLMVEGPHQQSERPQWRMKWTHRADPQSLYGRSQHPRSARASFKHITQQTARL